MKRLKTGKNWRVGWNDEADVFKGLVGADDWSVELTETEFDTFLRLLTELGEALESMKAELMDEEAIALEKESELLWMQIDGYPQVFSISFILRTGRCAEGHWSAETASELNQAIQTIKLF